MILQIFILLVGFLFLVKGADWFVDGAASIADKLGVPQLVVGLTIVAMGTSMQCRDIRRKHHRQQHTEYTYNPGYNSRYHECGDPEIDAALRDTVYDRDNSAAYGIRHNGRSYNLRRGRYPLAPFYSVSGISFYDVKERQ